jgi:hypothetical protein
MSKTMVLWQEQQLTSPLPSATGKIKLAAQGLGKKGRSPLPGFALRSRHGALGDDSRARERTIKNKGACRTRDQGACDRMQEISELEGRITAALERIGKGLDRLAVRQRAPAPVAAPGPAAPATDAVLRAQLEEEKSLTAQLQERLRAAREREQKGDLQEKLDKLTQQLDVQGLELQRMRRTNAALRDQLAALRAAQAAGVTEPQLINKAMAAELDALRALRLTEVAEMDEILAALEPHLTEA